MKQFVEERHYPNGVQAYLFRDEQGGCLQVLWLDGRREDVFVPLAANQEVALVRIDGSRRELRSTNGGVTLSLSDDPLLLLYTDRETKLAESLGDPAMSLVAAPGRPARFDGITLLPAISDVGWYFELVVVDPRGREKTIPVRPWQPPLINLGDKQVMTHSMMSGPARQAEIFTIEGDELRTYGNATQEQPLEVEGHQVTLGAVKRYTGIQVYNRPQEPILVLGSVLMFLGLVWHFYFRHRDRRREGKSDA